MDFWYIVDTHKVSYSTIMQVCDIPLATLRTWSVQDQAPEWAIRALTAYLGIVS